MHFALKQMILGKKVFPALLGPTIAVALPSVKFIFNSLSIIFKR